MISRHGYLPGTFGQNGLYMSRCIRLGNLVDVFYLEMNVIFYSGMLEPLFRVRIENRIKNSALKICKINLENMF